MYLKWRYGAEMQHVPRRRMAAGLALLLALGAAALGGGCVPDREEGAPPIGEAAVFAPPPGFLARFHGRCDRLAAPGFQACFLDAMAAAGASPEALRFARRLDGDAYLEAFRPAGRVGVAYVLFPFRANENRGWLLANGTPPLIDVDDQQRLDRAALAADAAYQGLRRRFPGVSLWPGDRAASAGPAVRALPGGGEQFVVDYRLRDRCHACAIVGGARYGFDFDPAGRFTGTRLLAVEAAP